MCYLEYDFKRLLQGVPLNVLLNRRFWVHCLCVLLGQTLICKPRFLSYNCKTALAFVLQYVLLNI